MGWQKLKTSGLFSICNVWWLILTALEKNAWKRLTIFQKFTGVALLLIVFVCIHQKAYLLFLSMIVSACHLVTWNINLENTEEHDTELCMIQSFLRLYRSFHSAFFLELSSTYKCIPLFIYLCSYYVHNVWRPKPGVSTVLPIKASSTPLCCSSGFSPLGFTVANPRHT